MSSGTWMPRAVRSEAQPWQGRVWRVVEAQHQAATMRLVDTSEEQLVLERLIEEGKPPLAPATEGLGYLLATPFRYPGREEGSRFRGPNDPGVFYGALAVQTALSEVGYWRWRFLQDAPEVGQIDPVVHTIFRVSVKTRHALDLRGSTRDGQEAVWADPDDYAGSQALARRARAAGTDAIVYPSVRDPAGGVCVAVLHPRAFAARQAEPETQTWHLAVKPDAAIWWRGKDERHVFEAAGWVRPRHPG